MKIDVHDNIRQVLAGMQGARQDVIDKAIPRALNRVGEMAQTEAGRKLRAAGYNFSASEAKAAIYLSKASRGRLTVVLKVRRRAKLLLHFNARETKQGVRVKVKGATRLIKGAFIGQLRNGEHAVFVRDESAGHTVLRKGRDHKHGSVGGWQAQPVRKLYGPSVGGAYAHEEIQSEMRAFIGRTFVARLRHELAFAMRRR